MEIVSFLTWKEARTITMIHGLNFLGSYRNKLIETSWTVVVIVIKVTDWKDKVVSRPLAAIVETVPHKDASITLGLELRHSLGGVRFR